MEIRTPPTWKVSRFRNESGAEEVRVEPEDKVIRGDQVVLRSLPAGLAEEEAPSRDVYEEVLVADRALSPEYRAIARVSDDKPEWPGSEVRTLVNQGPTRNRINLTIVGDGYTPEEKEKFFQDARRITDDMFQGQTFASYLPLFNVHAVFVPSKESGLSDGDRRDTALKLYRSPSGSKRAVMPGDRRAAERAIALAPATDFPILVANDDYYGGLGGRYAITTRSVDSGTMVLRHELGHNFGNVGEEYDGGQVYSGANHSYSEEVPWRHWVEGDLPVGHGQALVGDYPWQNLADGPVNYPFSVPQNSKVTIDLSGVGWDTPEDVEILMDGQVVPYTGLFTDDRSFFKPTEEISLEPGRHTLTVREKIQDGDNVLGAVRINAYDPDYNFTPGKVGAFPSFNAWEQQAGYRPTHKDCLMRDMRSTEFCPIDRENMWQRFLARLNLIDGVDMSVESDGTRKVALRTPALEGLSVRWFRVNSEGQEEELSQLQNQRTFQPDPGHYRVKVEFRSPEVRVYNDDFRSQLDFHICG
ncbi:MAG: M64 family metallopeptidase [Candidatus Eremiobacterota bacterium]